MRRATPAPWPRPLLLAGITILLLSFTWMPVGCAKKETAKKTDYGARPPTSLPTTESRRGETQHETTNHAPLTTEKATFKVDSRATHPVEGRPAEPQHEKPAPGDKQ